MSERKRLGRIDFSRKGDEPGLCEDWWIKSRISITDPRRGDPSIEIDVFVDAGEDRFYRSVFCRLQASSIKKIVEGIKEKSVILPEDRHSRISTCDRVFFDKQEFRFFITDKKACSRAFFPFEFPHGSATEDRS